jgi:uncharacterized membrane-anchored protein YitT (DUF2179 family)
MLNLKRKIENRNILKNIENKDLLKRYLILTFSLFLYSLVYNVFFVQTDLIMGGSGGIAIILKDYLSPSTTIFIISIIAVIFTYFLLGKRAVINSIVGSLLFPLFVSLTENITFSIPKDDMMLVSICGATLIGIANGLSSKTGLSSGGLDTIVKTIAKKYQKSEGIIFLVINTIIVITGGYKFGWRIVLYALVIIYIISLVTDKVLLGISMNKTFFIVTSEIDSVKEYILNNLSRGVTILDAHGGFSQKKKKVIMVVIPTSEYFKVKEGILSIDSDAFITITDSYQVFGQDSHRNEQKGSDN